MSTLKEQQHQHNNMNYTEEEAFNIINANLDKIKDDFYNKTNTRKRFHLNALNTIGTILGVNNVDSGNKIRYEVLKKWDYYQSIGCYREKHGAKQYVISYRAILELFDMFGYKLETNMKHTITEEELEQQIEKSRDNYDKLQQWAVSNQDVLYDYMNQNEDEIWKALIVSRRECLQEFKTELEQKLSDVNAALTSLELISKVDEVMASIN